MKALIIILLLGLLNTSSISYAIVNAEVSDIALSSALNNNMLIWESPVWCFDCDCIEGTGICNVEVSTTLAQCVKPNYEGACTGWCSLRMYLNEGPCPNGGGPRN
jgi:hypothetical protein